MRIFFIGLLLGLTIATSIIWFMRYADAGDERTIDFEAFVPSEDNVRNIKEVPGLLTPEEAEKKMNGWFVSRYPSGQIKLLQYYEGIHGLYTRTYCPAGNILHSPEAINGNGTVLVVDDYGEADRFLIYLNGRYIRIDDPAFINSILQQWNKERH